MEDEKTNLAGVSSQNTDSFDLDTIFTPKSDAEIKNERKSRKSKLLAAAIGDGFSALANLYFTTKGAPNSINTSKNSRVNNTLTGRLSEKFRLEDQQYNTALNSWMKRKQKEKEMLLKAEEKKDKRYNINDSLSVKFDNWTKEDYINQLYDTLEKSNKDENLKSFLDKRRFKYEPIWEWMDYNWFYEPGHDKKIDLFKGRQGAYLKRDLIESIFQDNLTTDDNLSNLRKIVEDFDNEWIKLK